MGHGLLAWTVRRCHESQFGEMKREKNLVFSNSEKREENALLKPR